jgi:hypothetical protein
MAAQLTGRLITSSRGSPAAMRIWLFTRSMPVTNSVTGCSTWMRALTSMKYSCRFVHQELDGARVGVSGGPQRFLQFGGHGGAQSGRITGDGDSSSSF